VILALLAFLLIAGPVIILCLSVLHWRGKASQSEREAQAMAIYAANLEGQLVKSGEHNLKLAEIAKQAIDVAAEKHFPASKPTEYYRDVPRGFDYPDISRPEPLTLPTVKFCVCNVSVRSDKWPVACPACGKAVGDVLDADWIE